MDSPVKLWNDTMHKFLKELKRVIPEQSSSITSFKTKFKNLRRVNSKKPLELWMRNALPYKEKIFTRDIDFFNTCNDEKCLEAKQTAKQCMNLGTQTIYQYWSSLDEHTKNTIWDYQQTLLILGLVSYNMTEDLQKAGDIISQSGSIDVKNFIYATNNSHV